MVKRIAWITLKGSGGDHRVPTTLVSPGCELVTVETELRVTPVDRVGYLLSELAYTEAALRAVDAGCDAIALGALPDYGIEAIRSATDVPVVGSGQASIVTAAGIGPRFAIVTIWPQTMDFVYDRLLREHDAAERCTSVRYVSRPEEQASLVEPDNFLTRMKSGKEEMVQRILTEIEAAGAEGADSVILGCNCMSPIAELLASRTTVPIIDPSTAAYRLAESMLALDLRPTGDRRTPPLPRQPLLADLLHTADKWLAGEPEECEVCSLGDDGEMSCEVERVN